MVGWGSVFEIWNEHGPKPESSCMTSHKGLLKSRFQPCSIPKLVSKIPNIIDFMRGLINCNTSFVSTFLFQSH